jgi:beta-lactamase superfamily II metal-dependent hydrolase
MMATRKPAKSSRKVIVKAAAAKAMVRKTKTASRGNVKSARIKPTAASGRLLPPDEGAVVRMYRTGHGDCFLLAFAGSAPNKPVYVLIDCGYKPGSPRFINTKIEEITESIRVSTGGHIDVAVITHEHQDHVNGITQSNFAGITIGETWFAWTENPEDDVANNLRILFKDKLLGLIAARNQLAASESKTQKLIDSLLEFELGESADSKSFTATLGLAASDDARQSKNKTSMQIFRRLAENGVRYLTPHDEILRLPGTKDVRVFAMGPPRNLEKLKDLDPHGHEGFKDSALSAASPGNYFAAAAAGRSESPFAARYRIPLQPADDDAVDRSFFCVHYGADQSDPGTDLAADRRSDPEVPNNASWRRIDTDWLLSAEQLALDINSYTNNSSLVLAFELGKGGKVLLFAADAQRGNWVSWADSDWKDHTETVTARDLLNRTVLYKVGHHGSHNATLNGKNSDASPNLSWMGHGRYARDFTAMITAVRAWAETQEGWDHPKKAIKDALLKKASGRVLQTDTDVENMQKPPETSDADWRRFQSRITGHQLYFDLRIPRHE